MTLNRLTEQTLEQGCFCVSLNTNTTFLLSMALKVSKYLLKKHDRVVINGTHPAGYSFSLMARLFKIQQTVKILGVLPKHIVSTAGGSFLALVQITGWMRDVCPRSVFSRPVSLKPMNKMAPAVLFMVT